MNTKSLSENMKDVAKNTTKQLNYYLDDEEINFFVINNFLEIIRHSCEIVHIIQQMNHQVKSGRHP